jgi:hypothetical protein
MCVLIRCGIGTVGGLQISRPGMPHVLSGCSANRKLSPQSTRCMGTQHNEACFNRHPAYGQYQTEIPLYIIQQLCVFGVDNIMGMTRFLDLPKPNRGPALPGISLCKKARHPKRTCHQLPDLWIPFPLWRPTSVMPRTGFAPSTASSVTQGTRSPQITLLLRAGPFVSKWD